MGNAQARHDATEAPTSTTFVVAHVNSAGSALNASIISAYFYGTLA